MATALFGRMVDIDNLDLLLDEFTQVQTNSSCPAESLQLSWRYPVPSSPVSSICAGKLNALCFASAIDQAQLFCITARTVHHSEECGNMEVQYAPVSSVSHEHWQA